MPFVQWFLSLCGGSLCIVVGGGTWLLECGLVAVLLLGLSFLGLDLSYHELVWICILSSLK